MSKRWRSGFENEPTYNGDTVVVDVGSLVELLLELSVLGMRLDTTGVQRGSVDAVGNHCRERSVRGNDDNGDGGEGKDGQDEIRLCRRGGGD